MKKTFIMLMMSLAIVAVPMSAHATSTTYTDHNKHEACDTVDADGNMDDLCPPTTTTTLPVTTTTTVNIPVTTTVPNPVTTTSSSVPSVTPTLPPNANPPSLPKTGGDAEKLGLAGFLAAILGLVMMKSKRQASI